MKNRTALEVEESYPLMTEHIKKEKKTNTSTHHCQRSCCVSLPTALPSITRGEERRCSHLCAQIGEVSSTEGGEATEGGTLGAGRAERGHRCGKREGGGIG